MADQSGRVRRNEINPAVGTRNAPPPTNRLTVVDNVGFVANQEQPGHAGHFFDSVQQIARTAEIQAGHLVNRCRPEPE